MKLIALDRNLARFPSKTIKVKEKGLKVMTKRQKLELMEEMNERNENRIKVFVERMLSDEPIRKRNDPRYVLKQNAKRYGKAAVKATPEVVATFIAGLAIIWMPAIFYLIFGVR